jgi:excisionase family DNA binding protein
LTDDQTPDADPWLTLAEIGEELRVNPATVRLWITKGRLTASRAGVRKWIVRRSDLDRMLAEVNPTSKEVSEPFEVGRPAGSSAASSRRPRAGRAKSPAAGEGPLAREAKTGGSRNAVELLRLSLERYERARWDSRYAPPSPGYIDRIRALADACEHVAVTALNAAQAAGIGWTPQAGFADQLPYELQPGGNRPEADDLWDEFDVTWDRLVLTATGPDIVALAHGYRELSDALLRVADRLDADEEWQAWERQAR